MEFIKNESNLSDLVLNKKYDDASADDEGEGEKEKKKNKQENWKKGKGDEGGEINPKKGA